MYDTALVNERIHDLMHFSLLFTGLLFWWRVLDGRRPPFGAPYLYRAAMLKANLMMVALLGALLAEKPYSLYRGSVDFNWIHLPAITDERIGGAILWLAGSAILVAALAVTIRRWIPEAQQETALAPRRVALAATAGRFAAASSYAAAEASRAAAEAEEVSAI